MSDRREEIAIRFGLCKCGQEYTSRGLSAPGCPYHSMCVTEAMDEYMKECCLSLLQYIADKNIRVSFLTGSQDPMFMCGMEALTKEEIFENFL